MTYRDAGEVFAKELYWAAIAALPPDELDGIAKRRGVLRILDDVHAVRDPLIVEDFVVAFYQVEGYVRLARAVWRSQRSQITYTMLAALQAEILARELVDEWHRQRMEESGLGDVNGSLARHAYFTGTLRRVREILVPGDVTRPECVTEALKAAEREVSRVSVEE